MRGDYIDWRATRRGVLRGVGAGAATIGAASLLSTPVRADSAAAGTVVFVYDDGPREDYTKAFPVHQSYGVPACAAVCPGLMGTSARWLTQDELSEMHAAGWEVMSHTMEHRVLGEIPVLGEIEPGDTRIHVQSSLHGRRVGDPLVIFDDDHETFVTSAGHSTDGEKELLLVDPPIEESFDSVDGRDTWVRYTDEFTEDILERSRAQLEGWGFGPVTSYVHPYNRYDGYVTKRLPDFYDTTPNRHGDPINPTFRPDPFDLGRINFEDEKLTERELVDILDTVAAEPYFAILYAHTNYETFTEDRIATAIELCLERDIEIVTLQEALVNMDVLTIPDETSAIDPSNGSHQTTGSGGDQGTLLEGVIEKIQSLVRSVLALLTR